MIAAGKPVNSTREALKSAGAASRGWLKAAITPMLHQHSVCSQWCANNILAAHNGVRTAGKPVNSNWEALKSIVAAGRGKQKAAAKDHVAPAQDRPAVLQTPQQLGSKAGVTLVVAIDCEMVGVGPDGTRSALAR